MPVNIANNLLGRFTAFEGLSEPANVFSNTDTLAEKLLVPEMTVFGPEQLQTIDKLKGHFGIFRGDFLKIPNFISYFFDFVTSVSRSIVTESEL